MCVCSVGNFFFKTSLFHQLKEFETNGQLSSLSDRCAHSFLKITREQWQGQDPWRLVICLHKYSG